MRSTEITPYQSWLAAQLLDSVRRIEDQELQVEVELNCDMTGLCNELTLAANRLHVKAVDLSFFGSLSKLDADVPLRMLLSKCINQRCQVRKFEAVALSRIDEFPPVAKQLGELVLCSLLGNYRISAARHRPVGAVRDLLFELIRGTGGPNEAVPFDFVKMLLSSSCRSVVLFCLREYIVFTVEEQPAVKIHVERCVRFKEYSSIVSNAMNCVRDHFQAMLSTRESYLYQRCVEGKENDNWAQELAFILKPFDEEILHISYRRPKFTFREFMLAVSNRLDDEEAIELAERNEPIPVLTQHITKQEIGMLRTLAERMVNRRFCALEEIVSNWFEGFGVTRQVRELLLTLMDHLRQGTVQLDLLKWFLRDMHRGLPRVFQLTQIAAQLIEDARRFRIIGHVPSAYLHFQLEACQERFGTRTPTQLRMEKGMGAILEHLCYFYYCDVCFTVYSLLAEWKSVYKQDYNFGLRGAVKDYQTGHLYCNKYRHNYRGSCEAQPLKRVFLLGNIIEAKKRIVMMCSQPNCGRMMKLQPRCHTNERGRACCYCTNISQPSLTAMQSLMAFWSTSEGCLRNCLFCLEPLKESAQVHVYPFRIYVCRKHTSTRLIQSVQAWMEDNKSSLEDESSKRLALEGHMRGTIQAIQEDRLKRRAQRDKNNAEQRAKRLK